MGLEAGVKKNLMAVIQRLMENVAAIQGGGEMETHREETEVRDFLASPSPLPPPVALRTV